MNAKPRTLRWTVAAALALLLVGAAHAGVQKCTSADGKVVFSDQPCANGHTSSVVRTIAGIKKPLLGAGAADGGDYAVAGSLGQEDLLQKSRRVYVQSALSPRCLVLAHLAITLQQKESATLEDVKQAVARFESECGEQVQKAIAAAPNKAAASEARDCRALRQWLEVRRARLQTMTRRERQEFDKFQSEVSVGC